MKRDRKSFLPPMKCSASHSSRQYDTAPHERLDRIVNSDIDMGEMTFVRVQAVSAYFSTPVQQDERANLYYERCEARVRPGSQEG